MEIAVDSQQDFNVINEDDNMFNVLTTSTNPQLIILMIHGNIDFIGKISYLNKQLIRKALRHNDYFEMDNNVFKIILNKDIYVFKKFGEPGKAVLVGIFVDKTNKNRLNIIDKQVNHLLKKSDNW